MDEKKKILVLTYYWPPSGGSGVQRWMYFCKYLPEFGFEPHVVTVDERKASYKFIDPSFSEKVKQVKVYRTSTLEPLKMYSRILSGSSNAEIPQGFAGESEPGLFQKASRFIRGNFFLPDARIGWNRYAYKKAVEIIAKEDINLVITTGPPHSTHLTGLKLKERIGITWISDFRDPWTEIYYNRMLYKTPQAKRYEAGLEQDVINNSNGVIAIGPGLRNLLMKKGNHGRQSDFHFVYNGYDHESFSGLQKKKDAHYFTICHIGILSENQPITSFLIALQQFLIRNKDAGLKVKLKFVGKVSPALITEIKEFVPEITPEIISYLPHGEALQHMMDADLLLNSFALSSESDILVSGKLMEYIATGNPILALGNPGGDAASLLSEMQHAGIFSRENISGIEQFLEFIYNSWETGASFPAFETKQYSRYETTRRLAAILSNYI